MGKKEKLREQPAGLPGGVDVPKAVAPRDAAPDAVPPHETPPMTRPPSWPRCVDAHSHARGSPSVSHLFIVLIEFGKSLFKHLARAPSLWGTPVAYARSHQELPHSSGTLRSLVQNYFFSVFHLDSYCGGVSSRSVALSSAKSVCVNPIRQVCHLGPCSFHL